MTTKVLLPIEMRLCRSTIATIDHRYASEPSYREEVDTYGIESQYLNSVAARFGIWAAMAGFVGTLLRIVTARVDSPVLISAEVVAYTITGLLLVWAIYRATCALRARSRWRSRGAPDADR